MNVPSVKSTLSKLAGGALPGYFLTLTKCPLPFFVASICVWQSNADSGKRICILLVDFFPCVSYVLWCWFITNTDALECKVHDLDRGCFCCDGTIKCIFWQFFVAKVNLQAEYVLIPTLNTIQALPVTISIPVFKAFADSVLPPCTIFGEIGSGCMF